MRVLHLVRIGVATPSHTRSPPTANPLRTTHGLAGDGVSFHGSRRHDQVAASWIRCSPANVVSRIDRVRRRAWLPVRCWLVTHLACCTGVGSALRRFLGASTWRAWLKRKQPRCLKRGAGATLVRQSDGPRPSSTPRQINAMPPPFLTEPSHKRLRRLSYLPEQAAPPWGVHDTAHCDRPGAGGHQRYAS